MHQTVSAPHFSPSKFHLRWGVEASGWRSWDTLPAAGCRPAGWDTSIRLRPAWLNNEFSEFNTFLCVNWLFLEGDQFSSGGFVYCSSSDVCQVEPSKNTVVYIYIRIYVHIYNNQIRLNPQQLGKRAETYAGYPQCAPHDLPRGRVPQRRIWRCSDSKYTSG